MPWSLRITSVQSLVRDFVSVATRLCLQLQEGLPDGAGLDPIQVIVKGCVSGRIRQGGEINGVKYWKHGFGAMLRDAKRPPRIPGTVDIDIKFGQLDQPTCYIFDAGCIRAFARSLNLPQPSELQVERACIGLVRAGVLDGTSTASMDRKSHWSDGSWSFKPRIDDALESQGPDFAAKALRRAVESLGPPRHKTVFEWDEVRIVNDPFEDD
jgi:hypothetical protein